tara:strand:- start:12076 stop:12615 length:540 start_codon:yes stop_codon:yes gene_type:complete
MALTKVTKHILHGSMLVQFKYQDLSDKSTGSSIQTFQALSNDLTITPLYADSILECTFSGSMEESGNSTGNSTRIALFINDNNEYEQGHLFGGPHNSNNHSQHGGDHNRIQHGITHAHFHNFRQSVGFTHSFTPGSTNLQTINVRMKNEDSNSNTIALREGFLIVKEISIGITTLSGQQ